MNSRWIPAMLATVALAVPATASATTYTVDTNQDLAGTGGCTAAANDCSLRRAIAHVSSPSDGIVIPRTVSKITLTNGQLVIDSKNVGIIGAGSRFTQISANDLTRVFLVKGSSPSLALTNLAVVHGHISGSGANAGGAGIRVEAGTLALTGVAVQNNAADISGTAADSQGGAGIYDAGGDITVSSSSIVDNTLDIEGTQAGSTKGGGGIFNIGTGDLSVSDSKVARNSAFVKGFDHMGGGGIFHAPTGATAKLTVVESDVSDNQAQVNSETVTGGNSGGGGIYDGSGNSDEVTRSLLSGNTVLGNGSTQLGGSAIFMGGGLLALSTSTAASNGFTLSIGSNDGTFGGALHNVRQIFSSTIADNTSNVGPGAWINTEAAIDTAHDTIFAGNSCATAPGKGPLNDQGGNIDSGTTCPASHHNLDPRLGPLAANGGPTRTMALLPGSPAVNTSIPDCAGSLDQRRVQRPQGSGCDVGAFEASAGKPVVLTGGATKRRWSGAQLNGVVNPNAFTTTYRFRYGLTKSYGRSTATKPAGFGNGPVAASGLAAKLPAGKLVHYRLVAVNGAGTVVGADRTFRTPGCTLKAKSKKPKQGRLPFVARCGQAAAVKLAGAFRVGKKKAVKATPVKGQAKADKPLTRRLKVPQAVLDALAAGKKVSGKFKLTATNAGGKTTAKAAIAKLTPP